MKLIKYLKLKTKAGVQWLDDIGHEHFSYNKIYGKEKWEDFGWDKQSESDSMAGLLSLNHDAPLYDEAIEELKKKASQFETLSISILILNGLSIYTLFIILGLSISFLMLGTLCSSFLLGLVYWNTKIVKETKNKIWQRAEELIGLRGLTNFQNSIKNINNTKARLNEATESKKNDISYTSEQVKGSNISNVQKDSNNSDSSNNSRGRKEYLYHK